MASPTPALTTVPEVDQFTFTARSGNVYVLPLLGKLKPSDLQRLEDESKPLTGLKAIFDRHAPGLFDDLEDADEMNTLMQEWQQASGITVGESSASSTS